MESIPLNRTTSLRGIVRFLRKLGAPVDTGLQRAKLPVLFDETPDGWIASPRQWAFVADMARREGIQDLGLCAAREAGLNGVNPVLRGPMMYSPTLYHALSTCHALVRRQASHMRIWLEADAEGETVRVCHSAQLGRQVPGHSDHTWHTTHLLIAAIREFAGPDWQPPELLLTAPEVRGRTAATLYPQTRMRVGQSVDAIRLPRELLQATRPARLTQPPTPSMSPASLEPAFDWVGSLRQLLQPYLADGYPPISFAAELCDCSTRTLQRWLSASGITYSKLVELARFDAALEALADPDLPLTEISLRLGYANQPAFSRAFRRWTGVSPQAYRRVRTANADGGFVTFGASRAA